MHSDFYATSAQVIPVLLLTLTLGDRFLLHHLTTPESIENVPSSKWATIPMFAIILYLMASEYLAIYALMTESDSDGLRTFIFAGIAVGLTGVGVAIVARMWQEVIAAGE